MRGMGKKVTRGDRGEEMYLYSHMEVQRDRYSRENLRARPHDLLCDRFYRLNRIIHKPGIALRTAALRHCIVKIAGFVLMDPTPQDTHPMKPQEIAEPPN